MGPDGKRQYVIRMNNVNNGAQPQRLILRQGAPRPQQFRLQHARPGPPHQHMQPQQQQMVRQRPISVLRPQTPVRWTQQHQRQPMPQQQMHYQHRAPPPPPQISGTQPQLPPQPAPQPPPPPPPQGKFTRFSK